MKYFASYYNWLGLKKIWFCLPLLLFLSCNKKDNNNEMILNVELNNVSEGHILLSDIGNNIEYYPISNQIPIGRIFSYKVTKTFIYVAIKDIGVVRFSKDGKLSQRIGKIGRGPGEYIYNHNFAIDENTGTVYVMDHKMNDVEVYDHNGNHQRNIKLPVDDDGFKFDAIEFFGSSLFMGQGINMGRGDHDWIVMDTLGNVLSKKHNPYPEFEGRKGGRSSLSKINGNILYWDNFKDTIFNIHPDFTFTPVCVLSKGEYKFPMTTEEYNPPDFYLKKASSYIYLYTILETSHTFLFQYEIFRIQKLAIVDKKSGKMIVTDLKESENGINNDIDNGLSFVPTKYFEIGNKNYLAAFIQPFELKKHVASDVFKNSTTNYPEKKKELEELANSLDENDNPVLMFVKLKE